MTPQPHDITAEDQHAILQHMTKVHPQAINKGLAHLVINKILNPDEAKNVLEKIGTARDANEKIAMKEAAKPTEEKIERPAKETPKVAEPNPEPATSIANPDKSINQAEKEIKPASDIIEPTKDLRTWELGNFEGQKENQQRKAAMKTTVLQGNTKAGGTGETFNQFKGRGLSVFRDAIEKSPKNTTLVTHSSVMKLGKVWNDMGRPDLKNMTPEENKTFAKKYNEESTENGDVETWNGKNGPIHVVRHGQTEDNLLGNFRSPETRLTDKGIQQAKESGEQIKAKLKPSEKIPSIITSSLPRTIHTSNIIHSIINGNPALDPSSPIEINDKEEPGKSAKVYQGSYDRLIKGGEDPEDPEMKRLKGTIDKLNDKAKEI